MAYKLKQYGKIRDVCYPSVIAAERPLLATRLTWEDYREETSDELASRGSEGEDMVARFNRQLRSGLGTGRGSGSDGE